MGLLNRISNWYHGKRIDILHEQHPEIDADTIRLDYMARLRGYYGMQIAVANTQRPLDYGISLINSVDESLPVRAKRFGIALFDALLPVT